MENQRRRNFQLDSLPCTDKNLSQRHPDNRCIQPHHFSPEATQGLTRLPLKTGSPAEGRPRPVYSPVPHRPISSAVSWLEAVSQCWPSPS